MRPFLYDGNKSKSGETAKDVVNWESELRQWLEVVRLDHEGPWGITGFSDDDRACLVVYGKGPESGDGPAMPDLDQVAASLTKCGIRIIASKANPATENDPASWVILVPVDTPETLITDAIGKFVSAR